LKVVVFNHLFLTQCAKHSFVSQRFDHTFLTVQILVFTIEDLTHFPFDHSDDIHRGPAAIRRGHRRKGRDITSPRYISCRSSMSNLQLNRSLVKSTWVEWILARAQWILNFKLIQDSMMGIDGCRDNWSFLGAAGTIGTSAFHGFILLPSPKTKVTSWLFHYCSHT
jgi:hypothetical protein